MLMEKSLTKEGKIKKSFDEFFSDFEEKNRRPSDFKQHKRSIYNILCSSYKNKNNKIDWKYILKNFVAKEKRSSFQHTNVYNEAGIIGSFAKFFLHQKQKWKNTWSIAELNEWNESFVITISRKYGYKNTQMVDWEKCIQDYTLDQSWCIFTRNAPIRTPISDRRYQ